LTGRPAKGYFSDEAVHTLVAGLVFLSACAIGEAQTVKAPAYTETGVIDFATARPGVLIQNSLAVIHGTDLSYVTRSRLGTDLQGGRYPSALPEANVSVRMRGVFAPVELASPRLIIFVVPSTVSAGKSDVQVVRQGVAGPRVPVEVRAEEPVAYPAEEGFLLARHVDSGEWVETINPARPGEEVAIYAGGLGPLVPPLREMQAPLARIPIEKAARLRVNVDGVELTRPQVAFVGSLPGYAGVYEIRLRLPWAIGENPTVLLSLDGLDAPFPLRLPLQFPQPQPDAAQPR
jgi:uncharacterized protein (TIGR03437 family)